MKKIRNTDSKARVALVTGGLRGIGQEIAQALAKTGYSVIATFQKSGVHQDLPPLLESGAIYPFRCDQREAQQIENLFSQMNLACSKIDALILNAGISLKSEFIHQSQTEWQNLARTLISGPIQILESAKGLLSQSRHPSVVLVSSDVVDNPLPYLSTYGACKSALETYFEQKKNSLREQNIQTLIIAPGLVDTDMQSGQDEKIQHEINNSIEPLSPKVIAEFVSQFVTHDSERSDWMRIRLGNLPNRH